VALVTEDELPEAGTLRVLVSKVGVPLTLLFALVLLLGAVLLLMRMRVRLRLVKR
jgi:hypothetical protein